MLSCCFIASETLRACPAFIYTYQFPRSKNLIHSQRNQMGLFILNKAGVWLRQPLQVNRVDQVGNIDFSTDKQGLEMIINRLDRFTLPTHEFSHTRWHQNLAPPCIAIKGYEVQMNEQFAYLFLCKKTLQPLREAVSYDIKKRRVFGGHYEYIHDEYNHLSFRKISLTRTGHENSFSVVAKNAEQLIRADVKNFFTLRFGAADVRAKLNQQLPGELGLFGLLQFYLKVLFFKIELSLTPEVQFYPDSLYMPMSLHSPVEASKYLNKGSGIFYSWESPPEVQWKLKEARLPHFQSKGVFHRDFRKFCRRIKCQFGIDGVSQGSTFTIDFGLDRRLVHLNFYPQLISDFGKVNKEFEENISEKVANRIGVYFETSKLPKGDHYWDFWISFGKVRKKCPAQVRLRPINANLPP